MISNIIYFYPKMNKCTIANLVQLKKVFTDSKITHEFECNNVIDGKTSKMTDTLLDEVCAFLGKDSIVTEDMHPIDHLVIWCMNCSDENILMLKLLFEESFKIII